MSDEADVVDVPAPIEEQDEEDDEEADDQDQRVVQLPRGGVRVETRAGPIQFGMPPETIKDSMMMGLPIPTNFVVPPERFNRKLGPNEGINVAEFEFPAYANFFIKGKQVNLIVSNREVEDRIRVVFQETLLGPENIDIEADVAEDYPRDQLPDLKKEMNYFKQFGDKLISIDMLLRFTHFDDEGRATVAGEDGKDVTIMRSGEEFVLLEDGKQIARIDEKITLPLPDSLPRFDTTFRPPLFGVTVLGSSHGFDPTGRTSGYVVWVNRRGIMVDPPPQSTAVLQQQSIPPSLIDACIITHCHADHDAGTFQKILREGRVTLITTPTIMYSFLRKYSALSGLELEFLRGVFHYRAVAIGQPIKIRGGRFDFFYTLHSIPCIGFSVEFGGRSMVFSADHMNDPEKINALYDQGVLSAGRRQQLLNFPWEHDIILHEAGVPPIHTPMSTLVALPDEIKQRLYVVHVSKKSVPEGSGLRVAAEGVQNTLQLQVERPKYSDAIEILDVIASIDLFSKLTITHAREVLQIAQRQTYEPGDVIVNRGSWNQCFYVVASGVVECRGFGVEATKSASGSAGQGENGECKDDGDGGYSVIRRYVTGEYFGEESMLSMTVNPYQFVAKQKSKVIEFSRSDFTWLLEGTKIMDRMLHLVEMRKEDTMQVIAANSVLRQLSLSQKTQLEEYIFRVPVKKGQFIWTKGQKADRAFIVESGRVKFDAPLPRSRRPSEMQSKQHAALAKSLQEAMAELNTESSGRDNADAATAASSLASAKSATRATSTPSLTGRGSSLRAGGKKGRLSALGRGAFIGDIDALLGSSGNASGVMAAEDSVLLMIDRRDLIIFFSNNPGVLLATVHTHFVE